MTHLLLHDVGLDFVGFVRGRLRLLGHFEVVGLFDVQVTLCFGLFRQRSGFGGDAFLIGLRFRYGRGACCFGALDGDVAVGFGGGNFGVTLDARNVRPAHVGDVLVLVAHLLDRKAHDIEPHFAHVGGARGTHAVADHFRFLDDLLYRELPDDAAQVTFHHQPDQSFALLRTLRQELLGGSSNGHGV